MDAMKVGKEMMAVFASDGLVDLGKDVIEMAIDATMEDGLLQDAPIVGTLFNLANLGAGIRDRLLARKLLRFLREVSDLKASERARVVDELAGTDAKREKVGEVIIDVIDRSGTEDKAALIGRLFVAAGRKLIPSDSVLRLSAIISQASLSDLVALAASGVPAIANDRRFALQANGLLTWKISNPSNVSATVNMKALADAVYETPFELEWALSKDADTIVAVCFSDEEPAESRRGRLFDDVVVY